MPHETTISQRTLLNAPAPNSVEIKSKSQFIGISRISGDSSMVQLDTLLYWDE